MDLETHYYKNRAQQRTFHFDPWMAEIDAMNHTATNMATVFDGAAKLVGNAFRAIGRAIGRAVQSLRAATPVEIEPVKIARPAQPVAVAVTVPTDERAAA